MIFALYRQVSKAAPAVLRPLLERRLARGKEDGARLGERRGEAGRARPAGRLIWVHAASVGESVSVLPLVGRMLARLPAAHVLLTTGTVTSARIMAERLPERAFHQFVPLDAAAWVARFLDHWRPDLALWVESELWPNLIRDTARRGVPMLLLNGRLSEKSYRKWRRWPGAGRALMAAFRRVLPQSPADGDRFRGLGAARVDYVGNLKFAAPPLPADPGKLAALRAAIGTRPVWVAASLHPGEDAHIAAVHRALREDLPRILTIVAPRHPDKGAAMAAAIAAADIDVARRAAGEPPAPETDVYIADTIGELGLFYRLANAAFIGGSLIPHGGQNPIEPAALGVPVLHGPHMENFAAVIVALHRQDAAMQVNDAAGLASRLLQLFASPSQRATMAEAALNLAESERAVVDRVMAALEPELGVLAEGAGPGPGTGAHASA